MAQPKTKARMGRPPTLQREQTKCSVIFGADDLREVEGSLARYRELTGKPKASLSELMREGVMYFVAALERQRNS